MALVPVQLLQPPNPKDTQNVIASLALGILLWIALGQYGNMVAQGVVEEKATRIMEVLLATIQPTRLLAGKVIGIGLVGLLQLTIVGAAALVAVHVTNVAAIPALGVASILADIFWFLLGFLFYATAYSAVASLVSRQEEVQSAVAPISIFQIAGYLLMYAALPNPSGPLATVCSLLPPFAPILMAVRMADTDVPFWQVGLAVALIVASIVGLTWLAGRIYATPRSASARGCASWMRSVGDARWVGTACSGPIGPQRSEDDSDAASCEGPSIPDPDGGGLRDPHRGRPRQPRPLVGRLGLRRRYRGARGCGRPLPPLDEKVIEVGSRTAALLYLVVMIVVVVVVDWRFLRRHIGRRLAVNVGIVLVFLAVYLVFVHQP